MSAPTVNGISVAIFDLPALLANCPEEDQYLVLCTQKQGATYTILAHKGPGAWQVVDSLIKVTDRELFEAIDDALFAMGGYPQVKDGYTYFFLCRYTFTMTPAQQTKLFNEIVAKHDRVVAVPPQAEVMEFMKGIADNVHTVTVFFTIDFALRHYAMQGYRCLGDTPVDYSTQLDPLGFEMALRALKWRMADPPAYAKSNNYTKYANGTNNHYTATLIRDDGGPRHMISDATDRQTRKKREEGLQAHFERELSTNVLAAAS